MSALRAWISRPVTVSMALAILFAVASVALLDVRIGPQTGEGEISYAVTIEYYGTDADAIERGITIPLEDAISLIPGIDETTSVSEYGKSRITVILSAQVKNSDVYLALRDAVDRVYARLPSDVQKPRIVSSGNDRDPVFIVTFRSEIMDAARVNRLVEREIKPAFGRIDGTGEIEVGGGETREIHVCVRPERAAAAGVTVSQIAGFINRENVLEPAGALETPLATFPLAVEGKFNSLAELCSLPIGINDSGPIALENLASIRFGAREQDSISRVNGEKQVIISVQAAGNANLVSLSRKLREETRRWEREGLEAEIILDTGAEIEKSILQVINAIVEGIALVIILLAVSTSDLRQIIVLSLLIPSVCLLTMALLSIVKISLDGFVLAGLAIGIGNIVDGAIVLTDACREGRRSGKFERALRQAMQAIPSLIASVLTTIVVLLPLVFFGGFAAGIRSVTISVGLMMIVSLFLTILFVPPFYLIGGIKGEVLRKKRRKRLLRFISVRFFSRLLHQTIVFVLAKSKLILCVFAIACAVTAAAFVLLGKDFGDLPEEATLFVHLEMDSGDAVETCDERCLLLTQRLKALRGVERIETNAKFGSAEMVVRFEPGMISRNELSGTVRQEGEKIPGTFVYVPDSSPAAGKKIEVAILGDDNGLLRDLAFKASGTLADVPWIEQVVLHFKDGPPMHVFHPDQALLSNAGISVSAVAEEMRWALHGPVALKWIENNREIDVRVMSERKNVSSLEALKRMGFPLTGMGVGNRSLAPVKLSQLGTFTTEREESKIYRKNRQRCVFMSVHTQDLDLESAAQRLWSALSKTPLPQGYAFELDKSVARLSRQFSLMGAVLVLAVVLVFIILAAQSESLLSPLLICLTVPLSLCFPIILLFATGKTLTTPIFISLIILTGMVVNNAILIADLVRENVKNGKDGYTVRGVRQPVFFALRRRIRDLLLTSGTSVFGAVPLLFAGNSGENMLTALAFVVFWGILGSLVVTVFFLPAFIVAFPRILKPFKT